MADFNTLYEQLKASAQSAAKSANTLVTMMTADENTDVGIDGFGLKPSFSKQLKTRTQPLIDQMSAFLDQSVATFDQFLVTSDARVMQFLQNSGYQVIGDYTDGPYTLWNYNSVVKYDGSLYKLKSDTDVPFTTTGTTASSWANDSSHFYAIDGDMLSQQLASDLPGNGSSLIGDEVDGTVKDALVRSRLNTREIWRRSLAEAGLTLVDGSFEEGTTVNSKVGAVWHIAAGQCYSWGGLFPKTVLGGSTPASTGGIGAGAWVSVGDAVLRANLASSENGLGASLVGDKLPYAGAVPRTQHDKNTDTPSVKDFGAVGDGVTDDTAAFQAAYDDADVNDVIIIPRGVYVVDEVTGTKNVVWHSLGGAPVTGIFVLPGTVWNRYEESTVIDRSQSTADGTAPLRVRKLANYTGGTPGYVNATLQVDTDAAAGGTSFEWAVLGKLNSTRTILDASEDCASYFQATKRSSGKVFGQVVEIIDKLGDPVGSTVAQELDVRASGLDSHNNRIACHIVTTSANGIISSVGEGIRFSPDGLAPIDRCIRFYGSYNVAIEGDKFNIAGDGTYTTTRSNADATSKGSINFLVDGAASVSLQTLGTSGFGVVLENKLSYVAGLGEFRPHSNANKTLGAPSYRWSTVYASTGSINTSDERTKTFSTIVEAETAAAAEIKTVLRKFRFNDSITEKGDKARYHFGVGAQTVRDILIDHGLDPEMYAFLCHDVWDDQYEDVLQDIPVTEDITGQVKQADGTYSEVTVPVTSIKQVKTGTKLVKAAGDMYGIRYEELLCFIIAAM